MMKANLKEHRHNWKESIGKASREKHSKRLALLTQLDEIREAIQNAGVNFDLLDNLRAQQREVIAQLATL